MLRAKPWESDHGRHQEEKGDQSECRDFNIDSSAQNATDPGATGL